MIRNLRPDLHHFLFYFLTIQKRFASHHMQNGIFVSASDVPERVCFKKIVHVIDYFPAGIGKTRKRNVEVTGINYILKLRQGFNFTISCTFTFSKPMKAFFFLLFYKLTQIFIFT